MLWCGCALSPEIQVQEASVPSVVVLGDGVEPSQGEASWEVLRSLVELPLGGIKVAFERPLSCFDSDLVSELGS